MSPHPTGNRPAARPPRGGAAVRAPRVGPAWYRRRRLATRRRVAAMSRRARFGRRVGILGTWALAAVAVVLVVAVAAFYSLSDVKTPDQIVTDQTATVLWGDGSVMATLGAQNRTDVPLSKVAPALRWAVLAAEDRHYYTNPGISVSGTLRAALHDLTGGSTQGGSGITQQYVKNAYLSDSQTLSRKLKELAIAIKLDRNYSKDQILEYYLNTIYFGRGAYGVQAAAQTFFGVDAAALSVAQAAVLAAQIRSPADYDPADHPEAAKERFGYVLDGMVAIGKLSDQQRASTAYPAVQPVHGDDLPGPTALIVNRVRAELSTDGISPQQLNQRGLRIQTTLSPTAQNDALQAVATTFADPQPFQSDVRKALVAVDPTSGAVLAYYGGDDSAVDQHDYAGLTCQAPGSSFKPFTLAVGLSNALSGTRPGYTLNSVVDGHSPQVIDGTSISNDPSDAPYASSHVTVARSMEVSLNTVFDAMAAAVGPNAVAAMAHAAGVQATCGGTPTLVEPGTDQTRFGIGIGDYPVRTVDQAVAYATIADGGTTHPAFMVAKVTANDGSVLFQHADAGTRAMDPKVANDLTMSLEPVASFSRNALAGGRPSASKTGTVGIQACSGGALPGTPEAASQDCSAVGQNSDAWTVGFTPSVSVAVWVGTGTSTKAVYGQDGAGRRTQEYGRDLPGRTWKAFLDRYLAGTPAQPLPSKAQVTGGGSAVVASDSPTPTPSPVATVTVAPTVPGTATPTTTAPTTAAPTTAAPTSAARSTPPPAGGTPPAPTTPVPPVPTRSPTTAAGGPPPPALAPGAGGNGAGAGAAGAAGAPGGGGG